MKRYSRKMLSILVLSILAFSLAAPFMGVSAALSVPDVSDLTVYVGVTLSVVGDPDDVTSGATINVYWDYAIGTGAILLNTTTGLSDGNYSVQIDVPDTPSGTHYVWVVDTSSGETAKSLPVVVSPELSIDPDEGLPGDELTLDGTGFDDGEQYNVTFWNATTAEMVVDGVDDEETDDYGSFTVTFDVPTGWDYGVYGVNVSDGTNINITTAFTIGPAISLDLDEGPEGTVVTITGRGFNESDTLVAGDITLDDVGYELTIVDDDIEIDEDGEFTGAVIIPSFGVGVHNISVDDGVWDADAEFEIDGASDVSVDPTYGSPGATITVEGANFTQIAGQDVEFWLMRVAGGANTSVGDVETEADGTFTGTFTVPAVPFDTYRLIANSSEGVNATDAFKVGIIAVIISPTSGPSGTEVTVTGTGFETGDYNATIGDELVIESDGGVDAEETLSDTFFVPTMAAGTYSVTIVDEEENEISVTYIVTETTSLTADPSDVAVGYNMSFTGINFAESEDTELTWYVYNSSWSLDISAMVNFTGVEDNANLTQYGNFTASWIVPDSLLLGNTYTVNATDDTAQADTWAETTITIVEEDVEIGPNMASYSLGDTVTFSLRATFVKAGSVLRIEDPSGELYFESTFAADDWTEVAPWQVVQIRDQIDDNSMYPYIIPSDAATGTWTWTLYEDGTDDADVIETGTITVLPTTAAQVDAQLTELEDSISDLSDDIADDIAGVQSDLADDIDALSSEIGDVASDVDGLKDEIVGDLADDIAAATAAANAAGDAVDDLESSLGDLEDSVGDIADTADSAKTAADAAADAASDAASAAEDASSAASGLTTLVYGAIGASLIAALAAIVSLMQISKRIAG